MDEIVAAADGAVEAADFGAGEVGVGVHRQRRHGVVAGIEEDGVGALETGAERHVAQVHPVVAFEVGMEGAGFDSHRAQVGGAADGQHRNRGIVAVVVELDRLDAGQGSAAEVNPGGIGQGVVAGAAGDGLGVGDGQRVGAIGQSQAVGAAGQVDAAGGLRRAQGDGVVAGAAAVDGLDVGHRHGAAAGQQGQAVAGAATVDGVDGQAQDIAAAGMGVEVDGVNVGDAAGVADELHGFKAGEGVGNKDVAVVADPQDIVAAAGVAQGGDRRRAGLGEQGDDVVARVAVDDGITAAVDVEQVVAGGTGESADVPQHVEHGVAAVLVGDEGVAARVIRRIGGVAVEGSLDAVGAGKHGRIGKRVDVGVGDEVAVAIGAAAIDVVGVGDAADEKPVGLQLDVDGVAAALAEDDDAIHRVVAAGSDDIDGVGAAAADEDIADLVRQEGGHDDDVAGVARLSPLVRRIGAALGGITGIEDRRTDVGEQVLDDAGETDGRGGGGRFVDGVVAAEGGPDIEVAVEAGGAHRQLELDVVEAVEGDLVLNSRFRRARHRVVAADAGGIGEIEIGVDGIAREGLVGAGSLLDIGERRCRRRRWRVVAGVEGIGSEGIGAEGIGTEGIGAKVVEVVKVAEIGAEIGAEIRAEIGAEIGAEIRAGTGAEIRAGTGAGTGAEGTGTMINRRRAGITDFTPVFRWLFAAVADFTPVFREFFLVLFLFLALAFFLVLTLTIARRAFAGGPGGRRRRQDAQDGRTETLLDLRLRENHHRRRRREGTGHLHRRSDRVEDNGRGVGIVGRDGHFADRLHALRIGFRQHGEGILGALLRRLADELGAANADGGDRRRHRHPLGSGLGDLAADEGEHAPHHIGMENARFGAGIVDHLVQHHLPLGAQREGRVVEENDADGRPRTGLDGIALEQRVALGQGQPGAVGAHHLDAAISGLDAADGLGRRLRKIDRRQAGFAGNRRVGPGNGVDDLAVAVAANVTVFFSSMGHVLLQDQDSSRARRSGCAWIPLLPSLNEFSPVYRRIFAFSVRNLCVKN